MNYTALDHVSYTVSDLDRSVAFYTLMLGEEPFLRKEWDEDYVGRLCGYERVRLEAAFWRLPQGPVLELLWFSIPPAGTVPMEIFNAGSSHLALVCDDMRSEFARLGAAGVEFQSDEVIEIPWGPYKGGLACFARDPDGIFVELFQLPPGGPAL